MNHNLTVLLTLLCIAPGAPATGEPNPSPSEHLPIYITHVTVIDTVTGKEAREQTVVLTDHRISKVGESKSIKPPLDANLVDGTGKYLIPGLWDMHVHAVFAERIDSMFPMFVANGVLGIRDMGTSMPLPEIEQLRKDTRSGARLGPIIVAAGPILDGLPKPRRPNFLAITTPEEGREAVDRLSVGGADLIKVYSYLSRDAFLAIANEANKQKVPFGGHVPFSVSALEASDAGQKSMEHLFGVVLSCSAQEDELRSKLLKGGVNLPGSERIRLDMDEATASYDSRKATKVFEHLAKNRTWQVPTLDVVVPYAYSFDARVTTDPRLKYIPASVQQRWSEEGKSSTDGATKAKTFEQRSQIVGAMQRAGVPMLAGTDAAWYQPYTYAGFSLHDELVLLVRAGLTPAEALQSATINPARFLGMEKDLGTIERGKIANLVLLDADPLADIHNTTKILEVFLAGKEFPRPALDRMLKEAEAAAKSALVN